MIISTNAIVLKAIPYGDTSVICRLFTEEQGKISVIAKGAWRKKRAMGFMLEPMKHIHIQYYHKNTRDIQILKSTDLNKYDKSDSNKLYLKSLAESCEKVLKNWREEELEKELVNHPISKVEVEPPSAKSITLHG